MKFMLVYFSPCKVCLLLDKFQKIISEEQTLDRHTNKQMKKGICKLFLEQNQYYFLLLIGFDHFPWNILRIPRTMLKASADRP